MRHPTRNRWINDPLDNMNPWWRAPVTALIFTVITWSPVFWAITR